MFIATIVLLILGFGFLSLVIGVLLGVFWGLKKKSGKKIKVVHKVFTIICSISGFVFFVVPVAIFAIGMIVKSVEKKADLSKFDTKIEIERASDFVDGFEVDGVNYVPADFLSSVSKSGERFCAFVYSNGDYESCYSFAGDSEYEILYIEHYSGTYVREDEYDEVFKYYMEESPIEVTVYITEDETTHFIADDFDRDTLFELQSYYSSDINFECDVDDIDFSFYLIGYSPDHAYSISVNFDVVDGQIVLSHVTGGGHMRGHLVEEENSEYLISIIEDQVDYEF